MSKHESKYEGSVKVEAEALMDGLLRDVVPAGSRVTGVALEPAEGGDKLVVQYAGVGCRVKQQRSWIEWIMDPTCDCDLNGGRDGETVPEVPSGGPGGDPDEPDDAHACRRDVAD